MKLKSLNKFISLLIFTIILSPLLHAEEQIDLWKKENKTPETTKDQNILGETNNSIILEKIQMGATILKK